MHTSHDLTSIELSGNGTSPEEKILVLRSQNNQYVRIRWLRIFELNLSRNDQKKSSWESEREREREKERGEGNRHQQKSNEMHSEKKLLERFFLVSEWIKREFVAINWNRLLHFWNKKSNEATENPLLSMFDEKAELLQKAEFRKLQPTVKVKMEQV